MKSLKRIFATILMLCMVSALTACGGNAGGDTEKNTQNSQNESTVDKNTETEKNTEVDDGKVVYKVTVVDEAGNPIVKAMVQVCEDGNCFAPVFTDDNGVAEFKLVEKDGYSTKLVKNPDGYEAVESDYVYFETGEKEVTLTVKKVQ